MSDKKMGVSYFDCKEATTLFGVIFFYMKIQYEGGSFGRITTYINNERQLEERETWTGSKNATQTKCILLLTNTSIVRIICTTVISMRKIGTQKSRLRKTIYCLRV